MWQGRTRELIAETYAQYLYAEGVKKLRGTKGNLGVQVNRKVATTFGITIPSAVMLRADRVIE
jgi:ABC-type uncharacterized transport system substrate-binding protein